MPTLHLNLIIMHHYGWMILWCLVAMIHSYGASQALHLEMVYKFSEEFKAEMLRRGIEHEVPEMGSLAHHQALAHHDRHRRSSLRLLLNDTGLGQYSLSPSNESFLIPPLGSLHYTFVTIGTPNQSFFVALDTGSDLLWVPCDCQECAKADWASYGITIKDFSIYSPSKSNTSKVVPCDDGICTSQLHPDTCNLNEKCTYNISYLSTNTSSSGIIVQDVISLTNEDESHKSITTPIYFGCGERQTGLFKMAAVDGLFGLGPDVYSVPSILSRNKVVPNVFSMCFSTDGSGRLVFGKMPSLTSQQTPLAPTKASVFYALGVTNLLLGDSNISISDTWIFDTGTSYTVLQTDLVTTLGDLINANTGFQSISIQISEDFILNYCWNLNTTNEFDSLLNLTIVFGEGGSWDIKTLYLQVTLAKTNSMNITQTTDYICLGIIDDPIQTIIGLNFMTGYEYFFNQETMTFSWATSDCYTFNDSKSQISPAPSPFASSIGPSQGTSSSTESTNPQIPLTSKSIIQCVPFIWLIILLFVATLSLTYTL